jgi:hypothetical protein
MVKKPSELLCHMTKEQDLEVERYIHDHTSKWAQEESAKQIKWLNGLEG